MKERLVDVGWFISVQPNQPNPAASVDEHIHLIEQDAVGVWFG